MSGYVALARFDGAPIDESFVRALAESIRFRGPDGEGSWIGQQAAMSHSLLATSDDTRQDRQPFALDGFVIVGDIRVDDRATFVRALGDAPLDATDAELVLRGYARWGEAVLERLIGDFSFAIWDGVRRRLFCARDQFARRPLFIAHYEGAVLATNNLPTLLDLPRLADPLDDYAIADFLLFGRNLHAQRTTFARIGRVPAAHAMTLSADGKRLWRYWTIPMRDAPRRISERDAQAEFREVMTRAVMDRASADRVVISLSGGLDSNVVAATLTRYRTAGVSALTSVWTELFADEEGKFAKIAADAYGIPIDFHIADRCEAFEGWENRRVRGLEPTDEPCSALYFSFLARAAERGRVILSGEGGDPALYSSHDHFIRLLRNLRLLRFAKDAIGYAITRRRRPPLLLRSRLRRLLGQPGRGVPRFPSWIAAAMTRDLGLEERWQEVYATDRSARHPYRGDAWSMIDSATWARTFEANDAGSSGRPMEWRSPYFDVRLIEFLFSLPPMPHFADKDIARRSMRGQIPEEVLTRRKTPLPIDTSAVRFGQTAAQWLETMESTAELDRWLDRRAICQAIRKGGSPHDLSQQVLTISLALWLTRRQHP